MSSNPVALLVMILLLIGITFAEESIVNIPGLGTIEGQTHSTWRSFLGIPFIKPPVGDLRWADPEPVAPWNGVLKALKYGPGCPQACELPTGACPTEISEDCVQLNIFTPRIDKLTEPQPVMVFFPGGNFQQGTAGFELYDGRFLVERGNIIVVTVNYRLGALGWLSTPNTLRGNYGFLDQREALLFIKKYISTFGGDPDKVTIFGQSAGATSIAVHLVSPLSKGLFHRAILESDPATLPMKNPKDAQNEGKFYLDFSKVEDNIDALRNMSVGEIVTAEVATNKHLVFSSPIETFYPWTPVMDGVQFSENPLYSIHNGNFNKVPTILGTVTNEALLFIWKASKNELNDVEYAAIIDFIFGPVTGTRILMKYPPKPVFGDKRPALASLGTKYIFACSMRNISLNIANHNDENTYYYRFDHASSFDLWGPDYAECVGHVCHGEELFFLFGTPPLQGYNYTKPEQELANLMIDYWTNFARNGDPNIGSQVPTWPKLNQKEQLNIKFGTPTYVEQDYLYDDCNFFDSIGYHYGWRYPDQ